MKKARDIATKIIVICFIGIMAVSAWRVYKGFQNYVVARTQYNETTKLAKVNSTGEFTGEIEWDKLKSQNSDIRAWVYSKDTIINYPIVRGKDNDYYLYRMFNGEYNGAGSLFMDANAPDKFEAFNTVVYGHHMKDRSMLASIDEYKSQDYYDKHKRLELITPDAKYHLEVVGFFETMATSEIYKYSFGGAGDKQAFIDFIASNNTIRGVPSVTTGDRIVTFSTCVFATGEERYVLVTKLVPWSDKELAAAKKEAKLALELKSASDSGKNSEDRNNLGFIACVKRGFYILKSAL